MLVRVSSEAVEALEKVENTPTIPWKSPTQKMKLNPPPFWCGLSDAFLTIRMLYKYRCVTSMGLVIKHIDVSALFSLGLPSPLRGKPTAMKKLRSLLNSPCGEEPSPPAKSHESAPSWKWIPQFQSSCQMTAALPTS